MELLKTLYGLVGEKHPQMSLALAALIGAIIFFSAWWLIGKQYEKEHVPTKEISKQFIYTTEKQDIQNITINNTKTEKYITQHIVPKKQIIQPQILIDFYMPGDDMAGGSINKNFERYQSFALNEKSTLIDIEIPVSFECSKDSPFLYIYSNVNDKPGKQLASFFCNNTKELPTKKNLINEKWVVYTSSSKVILNEGRYWLGLKFADSQLINIVKDFEFDGAWYGVRGSPYSDKIDSIAYKKSEKIWIPSDLDCFFRIRGTKMDVAD